MVVHQDSQKAVISNILIGFTQRTRYKVSIISQSVDLRVNVIVCTTIMSDFNYYRDNYDDNETIHKEFVIQSLEDQEKALADISTKPWTLGKYVNPTEPMCLKAIKKDGRAIKFVENPTPEMCKLAVQNIGFAIKYIKQQTHIQRLVQSLPYLSPTPVGIRGISLAVTIHPKH